MYRALTNSKYSHEYDVVGTFAALENPGDNMERGRGTRMLFNHLSCIRVVASLHTNGPIAAGGDESGQGCYVVPGRVEQ